MLRAPKSICQLSGVYCSAPTYICIYIHTLIHIHTYVFISIQRVYWTGSLEALPQAVSLRAGLGPGLVAVECLGGDQAKSLGLQGASSRFFV